MDGHIPVKIPCRLLPSPDSDPRHPEWKDEFKDVCDPKKCECDVIESRAVGREFPRFGATSPPGTPLQCDANFYTIENYANYNRKTILNQTENVYLADCCAACKSMNTVDVTTCSSYSFFPTGNTSADGIPTGTGKCTLHGGSSFSDLGPMPGFTSGLFAGMGLVGFVQKASGEISEIMNGTWYSTQHLGKCNSSTDLLGRDCWWREIEQVAQVGS